MYECCLCSKGFNSIKQNHKVTLAANMIRQYCHLSYDDSASDKNDKQHQKHAESLKKNNV